MFFRLNIVRVTKRVAWRIMDLRWSSMWTLAAMCMQSEFVVSRRGVLTFMWWLERSKNPPVSWREERAWNQPELHEWVQVPSILFFKNTFYINHLFCWPLMAQNTAGAGSSNLLAGWWQCSEHCFSIGSPRQISTAFLQGQWGARCCVSSAPNGRVSDSNLGPHFSMFRLEMTCLELPLCRVPNLFFEAINPHQVLLLFQLWQEGFSKEVIGLRYAAQGSCNARCL